MTDRLVHCIEPQPPTAQESQRFSAYTSHPNVVLLGDPGAGKTHLFRHFSQIHGAAYISARQFLILDAGTLAKHEVLFIDALDEKRTGRGDQDIVDDIARKLWAIKPRQVRIACRAVDWLGQTDLAAFKTYFEQSGGYVVLRLEPLTEEEQLLLLKERGVAEPRQFLEEAKERSLGELLGNPQNILMLADVVQRRSWPTSRSELFRLSTELLLSEPNESHARRPHSAYTPDELLDAAGAACAVRLISDAAGIGLAPHDLADDLPSYRRITLCDPGRLLAALCRRAFVSGPFPETVDYAHRTIAEFLAASFVAKKISDGLPFGRVRALLGSRDRPASELRGIHAWLALLSPENANSLIDADPQAVLSYGDAASLPLQQRRHLLSALTRLAETDPWFHVSMGDAAEVSMLAAPDLLPEFMAILSASPGSPAMRSVVLDSLSSGRPVPAIAPLCRDILIDSAAPYREREASLGALLRFGVFDGKASRELYQKIGTTPNDLHVRASLLASLYGHGFGANDVAELLNCALSSEQELPGGTFWRLHDFVPTDDVPGVLDNVDATQKRDCDRRSCWEVQYVVDKLLTRYLDAHRDVAGWQLFKWLDMRIRLREPHSASDADMLKSSLHENPAAIRRMTDFAIANFEVDEHSWRFVAHLKAMTMNVLTNDEILIALKDWLLAQTTISAKTVFLYTQATSLTFWTSSPSTRAFTELYDFADGHADLEAARRDCCACDIPDWRSEQTTRRAAERDARAAGRTRNQQEFLLARDAVRAGSHIGWLTWIGKVYFGLFSDVDPNAAPCDRLTQELGEENAEAAIDGLIALATSGRLTPLEEVSSMIAESRYYAWWYAVVAGLDEYVTRGLPIDRLSGDALRSAVAIVCAHPTHVQRSNVSYERTHAWLTEVLRARPELALDAYFSVAVACLRLNAEHVQGLHEIVSTEALKFRRADVSVQLLAEFPAARPIALRRLMQTALDSPHIGAIADLVPNGLAATSTVETAESWTLWLACGFICCPDSYRHQIAALDAASARRVIWALRDLGALTRRADSPSTHLSLRDVAFATSLVAKHYPRCDHPVGGWSGDTNPWDASELVQKTINQISSVPSAEASLILEQLCVDAAFASYRDQCRHALAQQLIVRADSEYRQPTIQEAVQVLADGKPRDVADLQALVMSHVSDLKVQIASSNTDIFKRFWNEDGYGRVTTPKSEESCRDVLVDLLRARLRHHEISVEPEGHMATDKRADIVAQLPAIKLVIELKRDYHAEVWSAAQTQLDRFYTRDPEAKGFGVYGIFWFGSGGWGAIPAPPGNSQRPESAADMESMLYTHLPEDRHTRVKIVVLDVSGKS